MHEELACQLIVTTISLLLTYWYSQDAAQPLVTLLFKPASVVHSVFAWLYNLEIGYEFSITAEVILEYLSLRVLHELEAQKAVLLQCN